MSQETNLNVAPYFDDFNANNDYYKVLFKPGTPVQARELNNLQSILQNQIEQFGQHFFKEGAKVVPGNTTYNNQYYAIELEQSFLGSPVSNYLGQLVGLKITGLSSGVTAVAEKCVLAKNSERGTPTLYLRYLGSDTTNNLSSIFQDNELLSASADIISGGTTIAAGEAFATTLVTNASSVGSSFSIADGIYFAKGNFVEVKKHTLLLDEYSNTPSYRIGLFIDEEIINSDMDPSLNDNAGGFNNFAAPGADRLKITTSLIKKELDDFDDNNFVELATVENGVLRSKPNTGQYNLLNDELARRTYAESGDYYVRPFGIDVKNSLNNYQGNNGVYNANQLTAGGQVPSDDLALYKISPGRAFVKGYDIETRNSNYLDVSKPRTTKSLEDQGINYNTGATLKLNKVYGTPQIGIGNTYVLSLRDTRVGTAATLPAGKEIGLARVYDFDLESGSYDRANENINEWDVTLYDIQTITEITLNENITLSVPSHIKGKYSGATAFIKSPVSAGVAVTVYDVQGDFIKNENFIIDGVENTRVAVAVTNYGISDIKSVFGNTNGPDMNTVGAAQTFSADTIVTPITSIGVGTISPFVWDSTSGAISTVRSTSPNFPGQIKTGNLIRFSGTNTVDPVLASVVSVGTTHVVVTGVTTVTGVAEGKLPASVIQVSDLDVVGADLQKASDVSFYTKLPKDNISNVDLTDASLTIRKTQNVNIVDGQLSSAVETSTNETFLPFTASRYSLIRSDGTTEVLTSDKVQIDTSSTSLQIYGLGGDDEAVLITTIKKLKPKSKIKYRNRVNTLLVDKSTNEASGITTLTANDGLTYGNYPYGTRVQDEDISLNVADVISVYKVYESANTSDPSAPTLTLSSLTGPTGKTADLVIGEKVKGKTSNACAYVAESVTNSQITFLPQNEINFKEGETVVFEESQIEGVVTTIDASSLDISGNFEYENGQKEDFYNYSVVNRKADTKAPNKKIKIYFANGYYQSTDDGDITTVDSYSSFNYTTQIQSVNGNRNTDLIDIRPRVSDYSVSEGSRSPLEFYGRTFTASGNSAANILASDETIITDFSWYLGRIDTIYLTKDGKFQVKYGEPSEQPKEPVTVDDALKIATAYLPPYLYDTSNVSLNFLEYKRYTMSDIKGLENRIKSLEYYTSLSLLEANTASLFLPDSGGINRFKSGFFVDNFTSFLTQSTLVEYKNSIDRSKQELLPNHYTTAVDLELGPVENVSANRDLEFAAPQGTNIKKTGDVISLNYNEVEWLKQVSATRSESVTPFIVSFWRGNINLTPASDNWVDTERLEANIINVEGDFTQQVEELGRRFGVNPQNGFGSVIWNSWETIWSGTTREEVDITPTLSIEEIGRDSNTIFQRWTRTARQAFEISNTDQQRRTGTRAIVAEQFDRTSQGTRSISRELIAFMRSRNVQFVVNRVKPSTRQYAFLDGVDVTKYCVPKLIEISMISGTFQVGERITGTTRPLGVLPITNDDAEASIRFRVAQSNHLEGPYNAPTRIYGSNPYGNGTIPASYSTTSTTVNVDTFSLANQPQGSYWGWVEEDMILVGETSGAMATVSNVRLVSDIGSNLIGSLFIPNPNISNNPRFETGDKVFTLINNAANNVNDAQSRAERTFSSTGILDTVQEDIISVRNAIISTETLSEERTVSTVVGSEVVDGETWTEDWEIPWRDPLAQSFRVEDASGIFLTSCDIFFASKDDEDLPVYFEIRTMQGGLPTKKVIPFSEVAISPADITISNDASIATTFTFKSPIYLEGGIEYCIVLLSDSSKYQAYISRVGETDLLTQTNVSQQPFLGSLFKSQNASTWEPSQWEDLKFTLYRANFVTTGSFELYNPELTEGNHQIAHLLSNPLNLTGRKIKVGIGSTLNDTDLTVGNTVLQHGSSATGTYVGNAGIATGTLNIINAGIGYTPISGTYQFDQVPLTNVTAAGNDAVADITITNGVAVAATISSFVVGSGGTGYVPGDVLGIGTIGNNSLGLNARLSVVSIANTSQLILDNVQGNFLTGTGNTVKYINNTGLTTDLNGANNVGGNVVISDVEVVNDGLHILVNHKNHGMYFTDNDVTISKVQSDLIPTKLVNDLDTSTTGDITVDSATNFDEFENVGVGTTNYGYLKIGEEILSYESADGTTIGITSRTIDDTTAKNYLAGTPVYKYELGGVSLRRINKTHYLGNVSIANSITFDSYNIKLDMGSSGLGRSTGESFPILYMGQTKSAGGDNVTATQNIPFEIINPQIQNLTVPGTNLTSQARTISGASLDGNEIPYIDQGFEPITVGQNNYMSTPRIIASKINETNNLSTLPGNKSFNMRLNLSTTDSKVSPMVDTQRMNVIFTSNRVNEPISNYITDNRVNSIFDDPNAFQYLSKEFQLENASTTLKIITNAYLNTNCDIRAFYSISNSSQSNPIYTPFPGYDNIDYKGDVIDPADNDGKSDEYITLSPNEEVDVSNLNFKEYTFTATELPSFKFYRIKIVMTSTSQTFPPRLQDLRVLALA